MGLHSEARLDHKMMLLIKQLNLYLNHFPKHEKYGLCQQIGEKQTGIHRVMSGSRQKNRITTNHVVLYQE